MQLPDVQALKSTHAYKLTRVGVTGIVKPVEVARPGAGRSSLVATFSAYVDLPADQRGIHMSRNVEAINATIDLAVREPTRGLENLAAKVVATLLERHDYATTAEVEIHADYFKERRTPANDAPTLERYELFASASVVRGEALRRGIGVLATGMTACPCAMEGSRKVLTDRGASVADIPTITHNQRNNTFIFIETEEGAEVEAEDLLDIAESSMSAPTFELLKRGDETALVILAHENPRFVEDVVREALAHVLKSYGHLPDDAIIIARSEAEESIHKHNAYAERVTTLAELRG